MKEQLADIGGVNIQVNIKYLGIVVNNKRNMFKTQKKNMLEKAHKLANMTYPVIHKSCQTTPVRKRNVDSSLYSSWRNLNTSDQ